MTRMAHLTFTHLFGYLIVLLCFASHLHAEQVSPKVQPPTSQERIAIIDPFTHQPISGERAIRNMEQAGLKAEWENFQARLRSATKANRDSAGLEEIRMANGTVKVDLHGRFRSPLIGVRTPDQSVIITHHQEYHLADQ